MEELFGAITATTVATVVALLVQLVKDTWKLEGKKALLISLGLSFVFFLPYHLIFRWDPEHMAMMIYSAIFYVFPGWLLACGLYSAGKTIVNG